MSQRKPSSKTHRVRPPDGINLVPFIDMITCLMFFLLIFAALLPVAIIDAPLPKVASTAEEVKKAKDDQNKLELLVYVDSKGLRLRADGVVSEQSLLLVNGQYPWDLFHKALVNIHTKKPNTHELTIIPSDDVTYETIIGVMDASRELVKGDPGYQQLSPEIQLTNPEAQQFNRLFSEVSIGGV